MKGDLKMEEKILNDFNPDEVIYHKTYYKGLLRENNRICILGSILSNRTNIAAFFVNAFYDTGEPIILLSPSGFPMEKLKIFIGKNYELIDMGYNEIEKINERKYNDKKIFAFEIDEQGFHLTLELAMLANKKLLNQGHKPLIVIDSFQNLYDTSFEEDLEEFFGEVFFDSTDEEQNVIFAADWLYASVYPEHALKVNDKIIEDLDCIITSDGYLNDSRVDLGNIRKLEKVFEKIGNKEVEKRLLDQLMELVISEKDELKKALIFDLNNGRVEECLI